MLLCVLQAVLAPGKFPVQHLDHQLYSRINGPYSHCIWSWKWFWCKGLSIGFTISEERCFLPVPTPHSGRSQGVDLTGWFLTWGAATMWWWLAAESTASTKEGWEHILGPGAWLLWQRCGSAKAVPHRGREEAPSPASHYVGSGSWRKCWDDALLPRWKLWVFVSTQQAARALQKLRAISPSQVQTVQDEVLRVSYCEWQLCRGPGLTIIVTERSQPDLEGMEV